jgi:flagellar protein FlbD
MIQLTRLNNHLLIINSDLVKLIENAPDTVLTLVTGEKIVVLESSDVVLDRIVEFRRRILSGLPLQPIEMAGVGTHVPGLASEARVPVRKS